MCPKSINMNLSSIINSHTNKPYSPEMADMVCKYYNYIAKNNLNTSTEPLGGEKTPTHDPKITHREASIRQACFAYDGLGFKESFVKAFMKEFDNIVRLYENQPTYSVIMTFEVDFTHLGRDVHEWTETETVRTWGVFKKYSGYTNYKPIKTEIKRLN